MKIGVLTGGGDVPGLNAAIRAITRKALQEGWEVIGYRNGWLGPLQQDYLPLVHDTVMGILPRGGTILGTSRTNPYKRKGGGEQILQSLEKLGIDALVPIGGGDTLGVALRLSEQGVRLVGVPKTIDNDIFGTDYCIGFHTALDVVMNALDNLHPTAEAHHRVMVVEVMGRDEGWVATWGGLAGGADLILVPEEPFTLEEVAIHLRRRHEELHRNFSLIVVAEGAKPKDLPSSLVQAHRVDEFGHPRLGGIGHFLAREVESLTDYETRVVVLGHLQRGGSPTSFDRILATRLGAAAVEMIKEETFGVMVALKDNRVTSVPLKEALRRSKSVDPELYQLAKFLY